MNLLLLVAAFLIALFVTEAVRRMAQKMALIDVPGNRSLHSIPTPRGGGLGIATSVLITSALWFSLSPAPTDAFPVLILAGLAAALGFWDDRRSLSAKFRLGVQFALAVLLLAAFFAQFPPEAMRQIFGLDLPLWLTLPILTLTIVWITNLYNFMDGSDGIAASQAATTMFALAALCVFYDDPEVAGVSAIIVAASIGFLFRNWPPAKIFMGDVGSIFLGFIAAAITIWVSLRGELSFYTALCLHGAFVVDATVTLITRFRLGQVTHQAHRTHTYQRLIQSGHSHKFIAIAYSIVNLVWLLPFAVLIQRAENPALQIALLLIAWLPLAFFAIKTKAGHEFTR